MAAIQQIGNFVILTVPLSPARWAPYICATNHCAVYLQPSLSGRHPPAELPPNFVTLIPHILPFSHLHCLVISYKFNTLAARFICRFSVYLTSSRTHPSVSPAYLPCFKIIPFVASPRPSKMSSWAAPRFLITYANSSSFANSGSIKPALPFIAPRRQTVFLFMHIVHSAAVLLNIFINAFLQASYGQRTAIILYPQLPSFHSDVIASAVAAPLPSYASSLSNALLSTSKTTRCIG